MIDYLEEAKRRASDQRPVMIKLIKPEFLTWEGMNIVPEEGIFVSIIKQPLGFGKEREDIVVDFSRVTSPNSTGEYTPHACFPVSAVKMSVGGELYVDCRLAVKSGVLPNLFHGRSWS